LDGKWKRTALIFCVMCKLGCFTFGGGWSIIAQMQTEFVEKRPWLTEEQIVDFTSLARTFPGIMVINFAVMSGYTLAGIPGAFAAAVGLSLPAVVAIGLVTYFYASLKGNPRAEKILNGVRASVIPIILSAGIKLWKAAVKGKASRILLAVSFALCAFTGANKLLVIGLGVAAGLVLWKRRRS
jgi:chromate transporter